MRIKKVHHITLIKDSNNVIHLELPNIPNESDETYLEIIGALEMAKKELMEKSIRRASAKNSLPA